MAKAFVFSMDAFVAFTLILVVIHSLVFLTMVPSSYYGGLTQANYYARDTLDALANTNASYAGGNPKDTLLDYILLTRYSNLIKKYIGDNIPNQYGYSLELWNSSSKSWSVIYDTKSYPDDPHNKFYHKLRVSSHTIFFGYINEPKNPENLNCYKTCRPNEYNSCSNNLCNIPVSHEQTNAAFGLVRLTIYR